MAGRGMGGAPAGCGEREREREREREGWAALPSPFRLRICSLHSHQYSTCAASLRNPCTSLQPNPCSVHNARRKTLEFFSFPCRILTSLKMKDHCTDTEVIRGRAGELRPELVELLLQHGADLLDTSSKKRLRCVNKRCASLVDATWTVFTNKTVVGGDGAGAHSKSSWTSLFSLARLGRAPSLVDLELHYVSIWFTAESRHMAKLVLPHLRRLTVRVWSAHGPAAAGLRALVQGTWPQLSHFEVQGLRMNPDTMKILGKATGFPNLGSLKLDCVKDLGKGTAIARQPIVALSAAFPKLAELSLVDVNITNGGAYALAQGFPGLRSLALSVPELRAESGVFSSLAAATWPSLEPFEYFGRQVEHRAATALSKAPWLRTISQLHMKFDLLLEPDEDGPEVVDESGFRAVWAALQGGRLQTFSVDLNTFAPEWVAQDLPRANMPELTRLSVVLSSDGDEYQESEDFTLDALSNATLPRLQDIELNYAYFYVFLSELPAAVVNGAALARLEGLTLNGVFFMDGEGGWEIGRLLRRLSRLELISVDLDDDQLQDILFSEAGAPSPLFPRLSRLGLRENNLTAQAAAALAAASIDFSALEHLDISGNFLGAQGYMELAKVAEIAGFPKLGALVVDRQAGGEAVPALKAAFPEAEIFEK